MSDGFKKYWAKNREGFDCSEHEAIEIWDAALAGRPALEELRTASQSSAAKALTEPENKRKADWMEYGPQVLKAQYIYTEDHAKVARALWPYILLAIRAGQAQQWEPQTEATCKHGHPKWALRHDRWLDANSPKGSLESSGGYRFKIVCSICEAVRAEREKWVEKE